MPDPFFGRGATVGIGVESIWGTPVARTNWLRVISINARRILEKVPRPHLGNAGQVSANRRQFYRGGDDVEITIEFVAAYDDSTVLLLVYALGAVATTGGGPYTHTVTLESNALVGLTIEALLGTGSSEVFEGCVINTLELSAEAGGFVKGSVTLFGQTSATRGAAPTPTYSSNGETILASHAGTLAFNSDTFDLRSVKWKCDKKLIRRRHLGSANTLKPMPGDFSEVTMEAVVEYFDDAPYDAFLADTQDDAAVVFTGATSNTFTATLQNAVIFDHGMPVSTAGPVLQNLTFKGFSDGTDEGLKLVVVNGNAAATAN